MTWVGDLRRIPIALPAVSTCVLSLPGAPPALDVRALPAFDPSAGSNANMRRGLDRKAAGWAGPAL